MPGGISAVDAVSPAFADTRRMLFSPWKLAMWSRMAVLGLLTGEFASGGGWSGMNYQVPQNGRHFAFLLVPPSSGMPEWVRENWIKLAICGVLLIALFFLAEYLASVGRFVLFGAVVTRHCEIRSGWKRWRETGLRYFFWDVGFAICCIAVLIAMIGLPLWTAFRRMPAGQTPNVAAFVATLLSVLFFVFLFFIVASVIDLFARDFLVPVMALENCGVWDGWRRVLHMVNEEKLAYSGYVLMKIVLAVGSAILFGIVDLIAFLFLLIPLGIIGVAVYLGVRGMNLGWNMGTISALVIGVALVIAAVLWIFAFIYSPGLVFFQSYALRFFASRFPALNAAMQPPAPIAPATPAAPPSAPPAAATGSLPLEPLGG